METTNNTTPVACAETRTVPSYFRGNMRFGRTTTLIHVPTGKKLGEYMGVCTRSECYSTYVSTISRRN